MTKLWFSRMLFMLMLFTITISSVANTNAEELTFRTGSTWYDAPWVWAAAAGLFLLVLVVILRIGTRRADV